MVLPFGMPCSGAPGDTYVNRPTVNTSGSTHLVTTFMGLTSSRDVTVWRTLPTWTECRPTLFFGDFKPCVT
jgi:hypothetical protein